jgi:hypothetical protein
VTPATDAAGVLRGLDPMRAVRGGLSPLQPPLPSARRIDEEPRRRAYGAAAPARGVAVHD